ncbi:uncharacterized protein [Gorilla gorilla gorilla]|uniref:uncharacterized protein isoform X6 n=1 Tax=Gorilla gorilla gorilla TaxID=9595 RepID=UPI00300B8051
MKSVVFMFLNERVYVFVSVFFLPLFYVFLPSFLPFSPSLGVSSSLPFLLSLFLFFFLSCFISLSFPVFPSFFFPLCFFFPFFLRFFPHSFSLFHVSFLSVCLLKMDCFKSFLCVSTFFKRSLFSPFSSSLPAPFPPSFPFAVCLFAPFPPSLPLSLPLSVSVWILEEPTHSASPCVCSDRRPSPCVFFLPPSLPPSLPASEMHLQTPTRRGLSSDSVAVEAETRFGYRLCGVGVEGLRFWPREELLDSRFRFCGPRAALPSGSVSLTFAAVVGLHLAAAFRSCSRLPELRWQLPREGTVPAVS